MPFRDIPNNLRQFLFIIIEHELHESNELIC